MSEAGWTSPISAEELGAYFDRVGGIHLHLQRDSWRLARIETDKCGTSDCFTLRLKPSSVQPENTTPRQRGC